MDPPSSSFNKKNQQESSFNHQHQISTNMKEGKRHHDDNDDDVDDSSLTSDDQCLCQNQHHHNHLPFDHLKETTQTFHINVYFKSSIIPVTLQNLEHTNPQEITIAHLKSQLEVITGLPATLIKLVAKGKTLADQDSVFPLLTTQSPLPVVLPLEAMSPPLPESTATLASTSTSTAPKILMIASQAADIGKINAAIERARQAALIPKAVPARSVPRWDDEKTGFGRIEVLPLPNDAEAKTLLTRLSNDPGIRGVMKRYNWKVPVLKELSPDQRTILGYNMNNGALIALRLRTDDFFGFRYYDSIRKVLIHELTHNVHSEHDENFFNLCSKLSREVAELDWSRKGRKLSDMPTAPAPEEVAKEAEQIDQPHLAMSMGRILGGGGEPGSSSSSTTASQPDRATLARAALARQTDPNSDKKIKKP